MTTATMTRTDTMTLEEVSQLRSGDVDSIFGIDCTIADSGEHLDEYYQKYPRYNFRKPGGFWAKVNEVAEILKGSDEWPFEPIEISSDRKTLWDGHHRSNAAILVGWDKPIPVLT
ncbi:hypothetical protein CH25_gp16 [Mycobacterium phage EagleEye]|uniref:ParB-like nuclease domain protein n=1 Tax=Mycobacterium phage EagleEye TaxID=1429759 RepID=W0LNZ7_9CAUD|nr:hypothetical protein CH25_gp16 [Mycobacterium phage EagleEye]AHG23870.1 ParB-like nuclease domain protein [Mycobacterium phage EagleEye]